MQWEFRWLQLEGIFGMSLAGLFAATPAGAADPDERAGAARAPAGPLGAPLGGPWFSGRRPSPTSTSPSTTLARAASRSSGRRRRAARLGGGGRVPGGGAGRRASALRGRVADGPPRLVLTPGAGAGRVRLRARGVGAPGGPDAARAAGGAHRPAVPADPAASAFPRALPARVPARVALPAARGARPLAADPDARGRLRR